MNKFMKWFFGKNYRKQPKEFWKEFFTRKLKEIGTVLAIIMGIFLGYFLLLWLPSSQLLDKVTEKGYVMGNVTFKMFERIPNGKYHTNSVKVVDKYRVTVNIPVYVEREANDKMLEEAVDRISYTSNVLSQAEAQEIVDTLRSRAAFTLYYTYLRDRKLVINVPRHTYIDQVQKTSIRLISIEWPDAYMSSWVKAHVLMIVIYLLAFALIMTLRWWFTTNYNTMVRKGARK